MAHVPHTAQPGNAVPVRNAAGQRVGYVVQHHAARLGWLAYSLGGYPLPVGGKRTRALAVAAVLRHAQAL